MKIKLMLAVPLIAVLAFHYLWGMEYLSQNREQEWLSSQIAAAREELEQIPLPPDGLEERLAQARESLAAAQGAFPTSLNTSQFVNSVLELAEQCGVIISPLTTRAWIKEKVGGYEYDVFRLNLVVEGAFPQVLRFTDELENGQFPTLIIETLDATVAAEPEESPDGSLELSVSLGLAVYVQPEFELGVNHD